MKILQYGPQTKEAADKCLAAGASELRIGSGVLDPHPALDKRQLQKKFDDKKTETAKKDNRNLFLIKEGGEIKHRPTGA